MPAGVVSIAQNLNSRPPYETWPFHLAFRGSLHRHLQGLSMHRDHKHLGSLSNP